MLLQAGVLCLHNCRSLSWLQLGLPGFAEVGERLRQLVSVIANTCGEKAGEITEGPRQLCWLLASSMAESAEFITEAVSVNCDQSCCMSANNTLCFSSLFQAGSICLSFANLCEVLVQCSVRVGKPSCSPHSSFPGKRSSELGRSFLVLNSTFLGHRMIQAKQSSSFFSCAFILRFACLFVSQCC